MGTIRSQIPKRILTALLCALILLCAVCPMAAGAQQTKVVRVGYVWSTNFAEGEGDEEYKSGYAYEYLQKVAYYTGWEYQYVYGDWSDIFQMLVDGQVDLMIGVSYTPERARIMDFPDYPMGQENYYIYVWQNSALANLSASELVGLSIGCTGGSMQNLSLEAWNQEHGSSCTIQTFSGNIDMYKAFASHAIDAVVDTDNAILPTDGLVPLAKVGSSDYYLAVRKNAKDILSELNTALEQIDHSDPYYLQNLHSKFFSETAIATTLTAPEKAWLADHPVIRVGYLNSYLPYCGKDGSGQPTGVMLDIFSGIFAKLKVDAQPQIQYTAFDNQQAMVDAVKAGDVDVIFPIGGDVWFSESLGLYQTADIAQILLDLVYKGDYAHLTIEKIGVNRNNLMQYMDSVHRYPDAQVVFFDSTEDCLKAIVSGSIDCTITNGLRTDGLVRRDIYQSLNALELSDPFPICMGVRRGETDLLILLNHGLNTLDKNYVLSSTYQYQDNIYVYTPMDFLLENVLWVVTGIVLFALVIILAAYRDAQKTRRHLAQEKALTKNLEDALEEAQCANRAKTIFLNNMSHDIRTPMNAIMGFTDIAMKKTTDPQVRNALEKIATSSDHLLTLINDVLDISRVESGRTVYTPVPANLCDVTDTVLAITQGFLADRKLTFRVHRPEGQHCTALTDPLRLREILINLLSNAVKFTPDGGSIDFSMGARPGKDEKTILVWFTVADTGSGMSEEFQKHLFEEFSQEKADARTQYTGHGLGMAIVKRYLDLMGGTISVRSRLGEGSTFTIELPMEVYHAETALPQEPDDLKNTLSGVRVLLAEDNALNAEIATFLLEDAGMTVTWVQDGQETLDAFTASPEGSFDIILMDIMMPHMDGYEAARAIRSLSRADAGRIPIVALTANAFAEDIQTSLASGMNAHLAKPLVVEEVYKTIARALVQCTACSQ